MLAYYVGPPDARRRIRESAKTTDETVARRRLEKRLREAANAHDGISDFEEPTHRRVAMNTLFDELLADYERRQIKGLSHVRLRLKAEKPLRKVFGPRRGSGITTGDVTRYVNERKAAGFANATVNREVELLRRALRLGVESQLIVRMPVFPKKLPEKNACQGSFETGDFLKVLPHLPEPLDDMARFAFVTGWRRGMLLGMKWAHVDRIGRVVTLPDSKNDDPQSVPLDDELVDVIERRWKAREYRTREGAIGVSEHVFHRDGQPIAKPTFNRQFAEARKRAGVPGKLFHDLRRTAARNMIRGGVPQSIAKRVTGHRSDSMFQRYDIASMDDKLEAIRKARVYAATRTAIGDNVAPFPSGSVNATDTQVENERILEGNWLGGRDSNPDSLVQSQLSYH
jgi:integrase